LPEQQGSGKNQIRNYRLIRSSHLRRNMLSMAISVHYAFPLLLIRLSVGSSLVSGRFSGHRNSLNLSYLVSGV